MRLLLLSDIHANLPALEAVLRHARLKRWDSALFLGDAVGYYTQPNETVALLRSLAPSACLIGNHEDLLFAQADGRDGAAYKEEGVVGDIIARHLRELEPENLAFLRGFTARVQQESFEAAHGGLHDAWAYLSTLQKAQESARLMSRSLCFVGHTHVPKVFASVEGPDGPMWRTVTFRNEQAHYRIPPRAKVIFNPGSVGQPRDGIPLASYAIFDEAQHMLELYRVEFDLTQVQRMVRDKGYPEALAHRLAVGK